MSSANAKSPSDENTNRSALITWKELRFSTFSGCSCIGCHYLCRRHPDRKKSRAPEPSSLDIPSCHPWPCFRARASLRLSWPASCYCRPDSRKQRAQSAKQQSARPPIGCINRFDTVSNKYVECCVPLRTSIRNSIAPFVSAEFDYH
jgi:hypothetical protein